MPPHTGMSRRRYSKLTGIVRNSFRILKKKLSLQSVRLLVEIRHDSRFPVGPARFMTGLMEDTFRLVGRKSPIARDTIDKYAEDIAVSSQRFQTEGSSLSLCVLSICYA